jgi:dTDP-4-dehydrorhamnose reductase
MKENNKEKLLVTGASGFLGSHCVNWFKNHYNVCGLINNSTNKIPGIRCIKANITNENKIAKLLKEENFDIIIHCAAIVNPDFCEGNYSLANEVNVKGTRNLVRNFKGIFIYISTDMLFDGIQGNYKETDIPNPINNYGKTKYEGEIQVQLYSQAYYILRTNFFGRNNIIEGESFAEWIFNSLSNSEPINLFHDYIYCPIFIDDLFIIIEQLLTKKQYGIYNAVGKDKISKYDFGILLAKKGNLNSSLINRVSIDDHEFNARRPKNMSMKTDKLRSLGIDTSSVMEGVQQFYNKMVK